MRTANLTLIENPQDHRTIDNLLASGWISSWQRPIYERAAGVNVCVRSDHRLGVRFGAKAPEMASRSRHEIRYGKTECELRGIVFGLITAGFKPRSIALGDAPDGLVTFEDGDAWVEFVEVVDAPSARYTNMMCNLDRDIKDDVDCDANLGAALRGHHLEFRVAACPKKSELQAMRHELRSFFAAGDHALVPARVQTKVSLPLLSRLGTTLYRADWRHAEHGGSPYILHIQAAAHAFSPLSLAPIALRRLERKRALGIRYGVRPLWLVLGVTDIRGVWDESMALLRMSCPTIDPFEVVVLHDSHSAVIWENGSSKARRVNLETRFE